VVQTDENPGSRQLVDTLQPRCWPSRSPSKIVISKFQNGVRLNAHDESAHGSKWTAYFSKFDVFTHKYG